MRMTVASPYWDRPWPPRTPGTPVGVAPTPWYAVLRPYVYAPPDRPLGALEDALSGSPPPELRKLP
ncbi:hypothetical protein GCM10010372_80190 [Streptomyces tauricus]|nr:hypothetical protein GCM10010372_80190 [Streptomyces tauricus]